MKLDKVLHLFAGAFIMFIALVQMMPIYALGLVVLIGIGKEILDRFIGGTVDVWDAIATTIGGLIVFILLKDYV